jgi:1,4-alpha-glucan branching enzyme
MPLAEHPFGGSWGYQVTGYYAPTSRFGHPDDFRTSVDRLHRAGIGVIMDWVPRTSRRTIGRSRGSTGQPLYEHADPRPRRAAGLGARYVFDYGNPRVRNFLVANALFWLEEMHVDGLQGRRGRLDAVPRLLARGRRVAAEHLRRSRAPRGDRIPARRPPRPAYKRNPAS